MRIFYAVSPTPNAEALKNSTLWHQNLYPPLVELGHDVIQFRYDFTRHIDHANTRNPADMAYIAANRPILERHLLDEISAAHTQAPIDLFFSYFYDACVTPETIRTIKQMGIRTVNFYCNAVHQFYLIEKLAPEYDACMVPEQEALAHYAAVSANAIHVQMAANPAVYKPYPLPHRYPVSFVGQKYLNREPLMLYLYQHGIDVYAFGPHWREPHLFTAEQRIKRRLRPIKQLLTGTQSKRADAEMLPVDRLGPPLSDDELIKLYSHSQISLGFSEVQDPQTGVIKRHIRLRDFEAPMSGALYFTGYQDELREFYEIDREIVCYDTPAELLDKVRYYLSHEAEADQIRAAGLARARRDHTWKNRFVQLFSAMGLA